MKKCFFETFQKNEIVNDIIKSSMLKKKEKKNIIIIFCFGNKESVEKHNLLKPVLKNYGDYHYI